MGHHGGKAHQKKCDKCGAIVPIRKTIARRTKCVCCDKFLCSVCRIGHQTFYDTAWYHPTPDERRKYAREWARAHFKPKPHPEKSCDFCGGLFISKRFDQRFCSKYCNNKFRKMKQRSIEKSTNQNRGMFFDGGGNRSMIDGLPRKL